VTGRTEGRKDGRMGGRKEGGKREERKQVREGRKTMKGRKEGTCTTRKK
jgi:hypothetical protein